MPVMTLNLDPGRKVLRQFGFVALAGFGILGWLCLRWNGLFGFDFGSAGRPVGWIIPNPGEPAILGGGAVHFNPEVIYPSINRR